ncbi:MAG: BolA/IbaG family iron-sulfur metabolism protein [Alphaproteobacteria bacterium]|nr:BolA/IbaG family iron-sulfur metabolism protein [Alphaproteobacteria bacterium]
MGMEAATIEKLIREGIAGADVRIEDLRGDGEHYAAVVTAEAFRGKTRIAQHRMVQDALQGRLGTELHALQIHTRIPEGK